MIDLELPYTHANRREHDVVLRKAPTYGRNAAMSRWHVPRTGTLRDGVMRSFTIWCSAAILRPDDLKRPALMVDEITDDVPVCGTCVGKATGAGHAVPAIAVEHEGGLIYLPHQVRIPSTCPGSNYITWHEVNVFVGRCLVCLDYMPIRHSRGYETGYSRLRVHTPATTLVDPCPWHAWDRITAEGICSCGAESVKVAA